MASSCTHRPCRAGAWRWRATISPDGYDHPDQGGWHFRHAQRFGGIPLHRKPTAALEDRAPILATACGNELIHRLLAGACELCGATEQVEVHHIRHLADLNKPGRREKPAWVRLKAKRRRKTLVACRPCHEAIHAGRPTTQPKA
ncbi:MULTISPECIES: HNH endonuclease [Pseudofrankia]|uniref:HNH endonuclease n=1 Tax=Pseudofrankia TaxID=2994363 RepID=UPI003CC9163F